MPRRRHRDPPIVAAAFIEYDGSVIRQLLPSAWSSSSFKKNLPAGDRPRSIIIFGQYLYAFTTTENYEKQMEFFRMPFREKETTWSRLAPMPTTRNDFSFAALNGKIYFAGGATDQNEPMTTVERFCPENGKWELVKSLPFPRSLTCLVSCQSRLYCLGGVGSSKYVSSTVQMFDPKEHHKSWQGRKDMLYERAFFAAVAIEENIYALGGLPNTVPCSLATVEKYNVVEDVWERFKQMTLSRNDLSACVWRGNIIVAGGTHQTPNTNVRNNVRFNEEWQVWYPIIRPRRPRKLGIWHHNVDFVEMYNFETGEWERLDTSRMLTTQPGSLVVI